MFGEARACANEAAKVSGHRHTDGYTVGTPAPSRLEGVMKNESRSQLRLHNCQYLRVPPRLDVTSPPVVSRDLPMQVVSVVNHVSGGRRFLGESPEGVEHGRDVRERGVPQSRG